MSSVDQSSKGSRKTFYLLVAVCFAPILASYITYYFWRPATGLTYGQLLKIQPVPDFSMTTLAGKPAALTQFKGKWLLVVADKAACAENCRAALHAMRQFRVAQGKDMGRVERLWIVTDKAEIASDVMAAAEGAAIWRAETGIPLPGVVEDGFYLIDPLGNQVIRYGRNADPVKVIKELAKFLKNNESLG